MSACDDNVRPLRAHQPDSPYGAAPGGRRTHPACERPRQALLNDFGIGRELIATCGTVDAVLDVRTGPLTYEPSDDEPLSPRCGRIWRYVEAAAYGVTDWEHELGVSQRIESELLTVVHRLLRVPAIARAIEFHRSSDQRLAAAVAWIALKGNLALGRRRTQIAARDLWYWFGVTDCGSLARSLADTAGMLVIDDGTLRPQRWWPIRLGSPGLMVERMRQLMLVGVRIVLDDADVGTDDADVGPSPVPEPRPEVFAIEVGSVRRVAVDGRHRIAMYLDGHDAGKVLTVSVPDAHALRHALVEALDGPTAIVPMLTASTGIEATGRN